MRLYDMHRIWVNRKTAIISEECNALLNWHAAMTKTRLWRCVGDDAWRTHRQRGSTIKIINNNNNLVWWHYAQLFSVLNADERRPVAAEKPRRGIESQTLRVPSSWLYPSPCTIIKLNARQGRARICPSGTGISIHSRAYSCTCIQIKVRPTGTDPGPPVRAGPHTPVRDGLAAST